MKNILCLLAVLAGLLCIARGVRADELDQIRSDTDPTKPVLFSLRNEYYNLLNDAYINETILRMDRLVLKDVGMPAGAKGSILRLDLPYATAFNGVSTHQSGLADIYAQGLEIPRFHNGFTVAYGTGFVAPSANQNLLGTGKWQIAPAIVPAQFLPGRRGFVYVKFQDFVSFAGTDTRPDVHYLLITPTFFYRVTNRWFWQVDSESQTNWYHNSETSLKSGLETGYMINTRLGGWVKVEVPYGVHRLGDWTFKATIFATRY